MLFEKISVLNGDYAIEKDMYVLTKGSVIAYVGKERPEGEHRRVIDGRHLLLMPAFYNAHGHGRCLAHRDFFTVFVNKEVLGRGGGAGDKVAVFIFRQNINAEFCGFKDNRVRLFSEKIHIARVFVIFKKMSCKPRTGAVPE